MERLDPADAEATGIDPEAIAYTQLGELEGASDKAIRDAGAILVTAIRSAGRVAGRRAVSTRGFPFDP